MVSFPTLHSHEVPADDYRTLIDIVFQAPGAWRAKAMIADSFVIKHQPVIINRLKQCALNLTVPDRMLPGF
jgi:hypothetical protein